MTSLKGGDEQAERLQEVGESAASFAHDISNLLTVVLTGCETLRAAVAKTDDFIGRDLDQVRDAADRARMLAQQLLGTARGIPPALEPIMVDARLETLTPLLERLGGPAVRVSVVAQAGCRVRIDAAGFDRALVNLVVNARHAMPAGGELTIRSAKVAVGAAATPSGLVVGQPPIAPGTYARVEVTDTGVGIAEAVRERLFQPFVTSRARDGGAGLGLMSVRRVVEAAGGYILCRSTPGFGTTITLMVPVCPDPLVPSAEGGSACGQRSPAEGRPARILLVEDEAAVRRFATRALAAAGHQVIEAASAEDAMVRLAADGIGVDLVVTDLMLPGLDGRQLLERLRQDAPALPAILVSGYDGTGDVQSSTTPAPTRWLPKPYSLKQLVALVEGTLAASRAVPTAYDH